MLDGNEEGVSCTVVLRVAPTVVLELDDDGLKLAYVGVGKE